jgi:hypothetical protein
MKVLFDCIVTQNPASKCSTTAQFVTLAELLLKHEDVFIYWPVPDRLESADFLTTFPQDPRIKYFKVPQVKDRMREYTHVSHEFEAILSFSGVAWDWDVMVTVRTPQVPWMKVHALSPRNVGRRDWSKRILVIEDMMVLSKKPTIAQSCIDIQDRQTIEGYFAADKVLVPAYHEKGWVLEIARQHFSMARVRDLSGKLQEVCHLTLEDFHLKDEFKYQPGRKMNVVYIGRLERTNARLEVVSGVLANQFILHSDVINPIVCTVSPDGSPGESKVDTDVIEIIRPSRQEFYDLSENTFDLGVFFHIDIELSMSMLEPVSKGMPEIVKKAPWSVGMFGTDYPFYVNTESEAYALVSAFAKDYEGMYAKFAAWFESWFVPVYTDRIAKQGLYSQLEKLILEEQKPDATGSMARNEVVGLLSKFPEFVMMDKIKELADTSLTSLGTKVGQEFDERGLVWSTAWNEFRLALKLFHGYKDASVELGHLRR